MATFSFKTFKPDPRLAPYVQTYYFLKADSISEPVIEKVFPDGRVGIMFSLDSEIYVPNRNFLMKPREPLLVGTMTHFFDDEFNTDVHFFGIRFEPAGFSAFFDFPLHEVVNEIIEFSDFFYLGNDLYGTRLTGLVDKYLLSRLSKPNFNLQPVLADIYITNGNIEISRLARTHFLNERTLERLFRRHTGISPQAFSKIVRLDYTLNRIRQRHPETSLLDIAFDCGYYDHAHLTREMKRYTGLTPSQL